MKGKLKRFLLTVLICCMALSSGAVLASCGDNDSGGKCKICHKQTTYTYRNGGWLCYSCSKR